MPGPDPATLTFSTRHLPPLSRHRALHELSERGLLPVVPLADRTPRVDLVKWRLPGSSVLSGRFGGVRQCGEPERTMVRSRCHLVGGDILCAPPLLAGNARFHQSR